MFEDLQKKVEEVRAKFKALTSTQSKVDAALARMPAGKDKARLLAKRDEARSVFKTYIVPAWNKITSLVPGVGLSGFDGYDSDDMGALPLIPIAASAAVTAAASAALFYLGKSQVDEEAILKDPSLTAAQKTEILRTSVGSSGATAIATATGNITKIVLIVGGIFVFMKVLPLITNYMAERKR